MCCPWSFDRRLRAGVDWFRWLFKTKVELGHGSIMVVGFLCRDNSRERRVV